MNRVWLPPLQLRTPAASRRRRNFSIGIAVIGAASLGSVVWISAIPSAREASNRKPASVKVTLPPLPNILRQIAPEEALELNASRPFSARPDEPAAKFQAEKAREVDLGRAIGCLAQAIYYEAGGEGPDGERAVAQVVLNRVRHPGYPSSVCGTVYQGSERTTGCQFTFTCDGSLRRIPAGALWTRAQRIAREAIVGGKVFGPVGHATHYHADYVLPYWADSLDKQVQLGRHIFYRLRGGLGSSRAFSQRYASTEPAPPSPTAASVAAEAIEEVVGDQETAPGNLEALLADKAPVSPLPNRSPLIIDDSVGSLIMPLIPTEKKDAPKKLDCSSRPGDRQFKPAAANDLRSNTTPDRC